MLRFCYIVLLILSDGTLWSALGSQMPWLEEGLYAAQTLNMPEKFKLLHPIRDDVCATLHSEYNTQNYALMRLHVMRKRVCGRDPACEQAMIEVLVGASCFEVRGAFRVNDSCIAGGVFPNPLITEMDYSGSKTLKINLPCDQHFYPQSLWFVWDHHDGKTGHLDAFISQYVFFQCAFIECTRFLRRWNIDSADFGMQDSASVSMIPAWDLINLRPYLCPQSVGNEAKRCPTSVEMGCVVESPSLAGAYVPSGNIWDDLDDEEEDPGFSPKAVSCGDAAPVQKFSKDEASSCSQKVVSGGDAVQLPQSYNDACKASVPKLSKAPQYPLSHNSQEVLLADGKTQGLRVYLPDFGNKLVMIGDFPKVLQDNTVNKIKVSCAFIWAKDRICDRKLEERDTCFITPAVYEDPINFCVSDTLPWFDINIDLLGDGTCKYSFTSEDSDLVGEGFMGEYKREGRDVSPVAPYIIPRSKKNPHNLTIPLPSTEGGNKMLAKVAWRVKDGQKFMRIRLVDHGCQKNKNVCEGVLYLGMSFSDMEKKIRALEGKSAPSN